MKPVLGLAVLFGLILAACSGGGGDAEAPSSATATQSRAPTATPEPTATPKPIPAARAREQCWDVWDAINVQNEGAPAKDWQLVTAISACRSTFSWNHVLASDFIGGELDRAPTVEEIIRVCLADAAGSQRIFMWSICSDVVDG
jgi:hypothetical protein